MSDKKIVIRYVSIFLTTCIIVFSNALTSQEITDFVHHPEESSGVIKSIDGVPIKYQVQGRGKIALVFVHGWSCDRTYWEHQLSHFSTQYRVVALDLAGHGESGGDRTIWSIAAFGQDVAAVVETLELNEVVLIGHSMGGPVILEAASHMHDRLLGLVGVDTFPGNTLAQSHTPGQIEAIVNPFREDFTSTTRTLVSQDMFVATSDANLIERITNDMASAPPEVGIGALEAVLSYPPERYQRMIKELSVPLVLISAKSKNPTMLELTRRYGMELILMDGVGHFLMNEDPVTFNRLLTDTILKF